MKLTAGGALVLTGLLGVVVYRHGFGHGWWILGNAALATLALSFVYMTLRSWFDDSF